MIEILESRRLLSTVVLTHTGTLQITGTSSDDLVELRRPSTGAIQVMTDDVAQTFNLADVKRIEATLLGGDDQFLTRGNIRVPMNLAGGKGNDILRGGGGRDLIAGQRGNDIIVGGSGMDTLIGGSGGDYIDAADDPRFDPFEEIGAAERCRDLIQADNDFGVDQVLYGVFDRLQVDATDQITLPQEFPGFAPLRLFKPSPHGGGF